MPAVRPTQCKVETWKELNNLERLPSACAELTQAIPELDKCIVKKTQEDGYEPEDLCLPDTRPQPCPVEAWSKMQSFASQLPDRCSTGAKTYPLNTSAGTLPVP